MIPPDDFDIQRSRAVEPLFFEAPAPLEQLAERGIAPARYQHAGVEYLLSRRNGICGDEPGVGKTAQAIMLSNAIEAKRTLVVCPASLRLNWRKEIWTWSTVENVDAYAVTKARDGVSLEADYVVISYDLLRNEAIMDALLDARWDHVILDEAHMLKDPKGNKRTRAICAPDMLPSVAGRITLLTGTPMPNQPIEVYNGIRLTNWDAIDRMSLEAFRNYFYEEGEGFVTRKVYDPAQNKWAVKTEFSRRVRNRPVKLDELQARLRKHLMVRRLKEHVLHELPAKRWHVFPCEATSEVRAALKHPGWAAAEKLYDLDPDAFDHGVPIDGAVSTARRLLGEAKAPIVAAYIDELLEEGVEKVLVTAWHHTVLAYLKERLAKHGLVYMDGATSLNRKQAAVDAFQNDEGVRVILGQTRVIGEGWTLTRAQDAVLAEPDWVPGVNNQAVDRLHRKGQRGNVIAHVPVVAGTLDEKVLGTAIEKDIHIHKALDARIA